MTGLSTRRRARIAAGLLAATLVIAACGGSDDSSDSTSETPAQTEAPAETDAPVETEAPAETDAPVETEAPAVTEAPVETEAPMEEGVRRVPDDYATIQEAVDAAAEGDLVLIAPGVYNEAVNVTTDMLTIRGLDRNEVILDGGFELENGIRVLGAKGVAVENMTAINYAFNGFFWVEADGYRASYLTAQRNGDYGIYAFDSVNGLIEHAYGAGSPDAGFYIGQCYPCNALINDVWAENNGLGYSGTDSGGNLVITNSQFNNNRSGIDPNSGSYELCYPERDTTVIGNVVFSNSDPTTPSKGLADLAFGTGITIGGGSLNTIERNLVYDHDRVGIAIAPFPEENPHDLVPPREQWDLPCDEQRELPLTEPTEDDLAAGTFLVWEPYENEVRNNVVSDSRIADLIVSGFAVPTEELGNCFSGNTFATSQPADIETLAPCDGEGSGDWTIDPFDPIQIVTFEPPPSVDYETAELPPLPLLPGMDDPENAPANPAVDMPPAFDTDSIVTPTAPYYTHDG